MAGQGGDGGFARWRLLGGRARAPGLPGTLPEWLHLPLRPPAMEASAQKRRLRRRRDVWTAADTALLRFRQRRVATHPRRYRRFRAVRERSASTTAKFMSSQFVLRGGSRLTPAGHAPASFRNFYPSHTRWQIARLRLAEQA